MWTMRSLGNLAVAFLLAFGLIIVVSAVVAQTWAAPVSRALAVPGSPTVSPSNEATAVNTTASVAITYDESMDPTTVSTQTFAIYGMQSGLLPGTYSANGGAITFTPTTPFKPGELVRTSATTGTLNLSGQGPLTPTVWQFRAAAGAGNGRFADSGQVLSTGSCQAVALGDLDGDGDLDAVSGGLLSVSKVWLNDGHGHYSATAQAIGSDTDIVRSLALGDLDKDGDLDLVLGHDASSSPDAVWFNDGSGHFTNSGQSLETNGTYGLALGDVDGDGDLDIVTAVRYQPNTVWLNDGAGMFTDSGQTLSNLGSEDTPDVELSDLDGDGDLDAVFAGYDPYYTEVWTNDGSGTFSHYQQLGVGYTMDVAVGDVDGDGDADIVLANKYQPNEVWLNDGTGTFSDSGQALGSDGPLGYPGSSGVALGDIDGDGDLDIFDAVDDPFQPSQVWLNNGTGTFADSGQALETGGVSSMALGDVDGDGDLDALLAPGRLWVNGLRDLAIQDFQVGVENVGLNVSFPVTVVVTNLGVGDVTVPFATAIYDDLTPTACDGGTGSVAQQTTSSLAAGASVTLSFTHPGFITRGMHTIYAQTDTGCATDQVPGNNQAGPRTVWVDPMLVATTSPAGNGREIAADGVVSATFDRALDTTTVSTRTFTVRGRETGVYTGTYSLGPSPASAVDFGAALPYKPGEEMVAVLSRDIRAGDGSGSELRPYIWQFRGAVEKGTGVFSDTFQHLGNETTSDVALGDVDGDGDLDAIAAHFPHATLYLNSGGVFTASSTNFPAASAVALGNLDGDADLDLVLGTAAGAEVWFYTNGAFTTTGQTLGADEVNAIALGDLDGDGDVDIVLAHCGAPDAIWLNASGLQGSALGTFIDSGQYFGNETTNDAALGDVDSDGDLDLVLARYGGDSALLLNDGIGHFTVSAQQLSATSVDAVAFGDLDGDGDLDLFLANRAHPVRLNVDGAGTFVASGTLTLPDQVGAVALGDVDGDGDLDAFLGRGGEADYANAVWLNDGTGVFTDSGQGLGNSGTLAVALGDLDGDGDLDAFVGNYGGTGEPDTIWFNNKNAPLAQDDNFIVPPASVDNILDVLANDSDPDGDTLALVAVGTPDRGGTAVLSGTTSILYTPKATYTGTEVFTYTVADVGGLTATAVVSVDVGGHNTAPVAVDDTASTAEDTPVDIAVLTNDYDAEGQTLTIVGVGTPLSGTTAIVGDMVRYTPLPDLYGVDSFDYSISDGILTATARVTVTVTSVEDLPTIDPIADLTIPEDSPTQTVHLSGITSGAPNEDQVLTVTAEMLPSVVSTPTVVYTSPQTTGQLIFRPYPDEFGVAFITVVVSDGLGTAEASFQVQVVAVNDPPQFTIPASVTVVEGSGAHDVNVSAISYGPSNESDQRASLALSASSSDPWLIPDPAVSYDNGPGTYTHGTLTFTPVPYMNGTTTLVITVTDGLSETVKTLPVTVVAVNDPPTLDLVADLSLTEDAGPHTVALSGITPGPYESEMVTVTAVSRDPAILPNPTATYTNPDTTGYLTVTPAPDRFGQTTVDVTVSDGDLAITQSFTVTISPINDPPTLDPVADQTLDEDGYGQPVPVPLTGISPGPFESEPVTLTATVADTTLLVPPTIDYTSPAVTGTLLLTPTGNAFGATSVEVSVTDGLLVTTRAFSATVQPAFRVFAVDATRTSLSVTCTRPLAGGTVTATSFRVYGQQTGSYSGARTVRTIPYDVFTFGVADFVPAQPFHPGELIAATLTDAVQSTDGRSLPPFSWQFRAPVAGGTGVFDRVDTYAMEAATSPDFLTSSGFFLPQSVLDTQAVALGDLDGDGDLDALVVRNGAPGAVWLNDGTGSFSDSGQVLGPMNSWAVALGDLDGDGDLDAFVGNYGGGDTIWLNQTAQGAAAQFVESSQHLGSTDTYAVALLDVDYDGDLDAVTGSDVGQANRLWLNAGGLQGGTPGTFTNSGERLGYEAVRALATGDFDNDGDLDLFLGIAGDRPNQVWFNSGGRQQGTPGTFVDSGQRLGAADTFAVATGDLDGDGDVDALMGNMGGEPNEIWLNLSAQGARGVFVNSGQHLGSRATWAIALGDLDADGDLDAFVGNAQAPLLTDSSDQVWMNDGNGNFTDSGQSLGDWDTLSVALGDVDGDGDLDALTGTNNGLLEPNAVWRNRPTPPFAAGDAFIVLADAPLMLDVLNDDVDPEGGPLYVSSVGPPGHGTATTDGQLVTYAPLPKFTGQDTFTYTVQDRDGLDDVAAVTLTVLTETLQIETGPTEGGVLIHAAGQRQPTVVEVPGGAVDVPTTLECVPTALTEPLAAPGIAADHLFALSASRDGSLVPDLIFSGPVTVTIYYSPTPNAPPPGLRRWDGATWSADDVSLISSEPTIGKLVAQISQTGQYALFNPAGAFSKRVFLPLVMNWNDGGVR